MSSIRVSTVVLEESSEMASLKTVIACVVVFLWSFGAISAATTSQAPDYGKGPTNAKSSLIIDGLLQGKPENERGSILRRRERGTSTTNQQHVDSAVSFPDGYVRLDVQFPKRTENVSTELREVLRKMERIESSLKTLEAESLNAKKNENHSLGSGNANQARPGHLLWTDCWDVLRSGHNVSGVYRINPLPRDVNAFPVYCNMDTHGGGWTVLQTRKNGQTNFYQDWNHYKEGFGDTSEEYWLGLERMHQMTNSKHYELLIELKDFANATRFGTWDRFVLGSEAEGYHIAELGTYKGDAGDCLTVQGHAKFSTWDVDNDTYDKSCARQYTGAWWYTACFESHLNGPYLRGEVVNYPVNAAGVVWFKWHGLNYSLKESRISIRPRSVAAS